MKLDATIDSDFTITAKSIFELFNPDTQILYHYTSIDALFGGIIVKDNPQPNKEICLWATNCLYMNDPEELNSGVQLAHEVLKIPSKESIQSLKERVKDDVYIVSFSSAIECLPMWNMYGKNGHGLALGFDTTELSKIYNLYKCIYATEANKEWIKNEILKIPTDWWKQVKIENILSNTLENADSMFLLYLTLWLSGKNPAYEYEKETRCIFINRNNIKYRLRDNLIVPYIEQYIPKSALKEIWIGPTNDMERATRSLRTYLDHMGFNDVEIKQSKVPYRD